MFKAFRRVFAAATVAILAFRAVGSFLSWVEHQEDSVADTWVDEDEFEDALPKREMSRQRERPRWLLSLLRILDEML